MLFIKRNLRQQYEGMESFQKEQRALREKTKLNLQPQGYDAYLCGTYSSFWYNELSVANLQKADLTLQPSVAKICIQQRRQVGYFFQQQGVLSAEEQMEKYDKHVFWVFYRKQDDMQTFVSAWANLQRVLV